MTLLKVLSLLMRGQWEELINETKDGKRYKSMRHGLSFMEEMDQLFTGRVATGVHAFSAAAWAFDAPRDGALRSCCPNPTVAFHPRRKENRAQSRTRPHP